MLHSLNPTKCPLYFNKYSFLNQLHQDTFSAFVPFFHGCACKKGQKQWMSFNIILLEGKLKLEYSKHLKYREKVRCLKFIPCVFRFLA